MRPYSQERILVLFPLCCEDLQFEIYLSYLVNLSKWHPLLSNLLVL